MSSWETSGQDLGDGRSVGRKQDLRLQAQSHELPSE